MSNFESKLRKFKDFISLGSELFTGGVDTYDDPQGLYVPYDYHWDVKKFFNELSFEDKQKLIAYDSVFYRKLAQFHQDILSGNTTEYQPEEDIDG